MAATVTVDDMLIDVLAFWAEGVQAGNFSWADLPRAKRLRKIPAWGAAWDQLKDDHKTVCCVAGGWAICRSLASRLRCPRPIALRSN
jgi:hypothetical protein